MRLPRPANVIRRYGNPTLFLAMAIGIVYALAGNLPLLKAEKRVNEKAETADLSSEILRDPKILPSEVERMRRAILEAAASGDVEAMRIPVEMNEIPPLFAGDKTADPIALWRKQSVDGEGREILATLIELLRTGFVRKSAGTGDEIYVWPYFAEMPLDRLTPGQEVELLTIVPPEHFKAMKAAGRYDGYRLGIGHDGTWHFFTRDKS